MNRVCCRCKNELDSSLFYKNPRSKDGLAYACKSCVNTKSKDRYIPRRPKDLPNKEGEIWRDIPGYEGKYQISNLSRVKNLKTGTILKPDDFGRYLTVALYDHDLVKKRRSIHRLMGLTFIDNPLNKPQINHKKGIKKINILEDLEWSTAKENVNHAHKTGLTKSKGQDNWCSKLKEKDVIYIRESCYKVYTVRELANKFNVTIHSIYQIMQRRTWKHLLIP